jgi:hypothetical protein
MTPAQPISQRDICIYRAKTGVLVGAPCAIFQGGGCRSNSAAFQSIVALATAVRICVEMPMIAFPRRNIRHNARRSKKKPASGELLPFHKD